MMGISLIFLLFTLCAAVPTTDHRYVTPTARTGVQLNNPNRPFTRCPCSPTSRGYPQATDAFVANLTAAYDSYFGYTGRQLRKTAELTRILTDANRAVIAVHGREGAINYDAARLRQRGPGLCVYDTDTGLNVPHVNGTGDPLPSCFSTEYQSTESQRAKFVGVGENLTSVAPPAGLIVVPTPVPVVKSRNEGCVAVEHLEGYPVQHGTHWRRHVLCARGFCATPNHAIIVDGLWASMRRMCGAGGWTCHEEIRFVNNLKISYVRRVTFDERIIITPYDARVPRWVSWVVQMTEDVLALVVFALQMGVALCIAVWAHACWQGCAVEVASKPRLQGVASASCAFKRQCGDEVRAPTDSFSPAMIAC